MAENMRSLIPTRGEEPPLARSSHRAARCVAAHDFQRRFLLECLLDREFDDIRYCLDCVAAVGRQSSRAGPERAQLRHHAPGLPNMSSTTRVISRPSRTASSVGCSPHADRSRPARAAAGRSRLPRAPRSRAAAARKRRRHSPAGRAGRRRSRHRDVAAHSSPDAGSRRRAGPALPTPRGTVLRTVLAERALRRRQRPALPFAASVASRRPCPSARSRADAARGPWTLSRAGPPALDPEHLFPPGDLADKEPAELFRENSARPRSDSPPSRVPHRPAGWRVGPGAHAPPSATARKRRSARHKPSLAQGELPTPQPARELSLRELARSGNLGLFVLHQLAACAVCRWASAAGARSGEDRECPPGPAGPG